MSNNLKKRAWKVLAIGVLVCSVWVFALACQRQARPADTPEATIAPTLEQTPAPITPTPSPTPAFTPHYIWRYFPVEISFPAYNVFAPVLPMGLDGTNIATPDSATDAGWYQYNASPDEEGNCIIHGHDAWKGQQGAFAVLKQMQVGDEAVVELEDGRLVYYEVVARQELGINDFPPEMLSNEGEARLTLITCKGDYDSTIGTSQTRVVLTCKRVRIEGEPGPVDYELLEQLEREFEEVLAKHPDGEGIDFETYGECEWNIRLNMM